MDAIETLMSPQTQNARQRLVQGLVTAIVRSRQADGTYLLEYLTMGEDEPSAPARVMMPMAGKERGMYFFPEPGDEVVVSFELGNTNLPVILGAVWNRNDPVPNAADTSTDNNTRTIVSRSGHQLTFDDTKASEKITIKTQGGHTLTFDDTPGGMTITLATAGGVQLSLSDVGGSLSITAPTQISLQSPTINLTGSAITLLTTGVPTASLVTIDGIPFGLHKHIPALLPDGATGIVAPPGV